MSSAPVISRVPNPTPGDAPPAGSVAAPRGGPLKRGGAKTFIQVLSEGQRSRPAQIPPAGPGQEPVTPLGAVASSGVQKANGVRAMAENALRAESRVDALIASVGRGRTFSAADLIALQATVFRYSQTVEVISRGADRVVGAIKQTLGTQV